MKPIHTLIILLTTIILLLSLSFIIPEEGLHLGNLKIKYPNPDELLSLAEKKKPQIPKNLTKKLDSLIITDELRIDSLPDKKDSLTTTKDSIQKKEKPTKKSAAFYAPIEYPDKKVLYPFFNSLSALKENDALIRVLHYGDSQIEGDRITSLVRNELQKEFGGSGMGMFPAVLIKGTETSLRIIREGQWSRYTIKSIERGTIPHKRLGALMSFSRFAPYAIKNTGEYKASINIKPSNISYYRTREFEQLKMFYGYNNQPFISELQYKNQSIDAEIIPANKNLNVVTWDLGNTVDEITLSFKGMDSPDIFAMAIDGREGIAMDNIPLRGSSGTDFTRTDIPFLREMMKRLNVKLILFQFGVNVVPHIIDNYSYYERQFYKQLRLLKSIDPDMCILVLGVSDMSRNVKGEYVSYPNITAIRNAQKAAAFKADCAFWDTYEAMGGKNSMPAWVNHEPQLARKDYTHFTYTGSRVIAKSFYQSLMNEYHQYINEKEEQNR